jgi:hypothetical protein
MALEKELETFRRELPKLLADSNNRDKYALVFGERIEGVWPTREEALAAGYERFNIQPFMVKRITEREKPRCPDRLRRGQRQPTDHVGEDELPSAVRRSRQGTARHWLFRLRLHAQRLSVPGTDPH